jgi:hypothetical protein
VNSPVTLHPNLQAEKLAAAAAAEEADEQENENPAVAVDAQPSIDAQGPTGAAGTAAAPANPGPPAPQQQPAAQGSKGGCRIMYVRDPLPMIMKGRMSFGSKPPAASEEDVNAKDAQPVVQASTTSKRSAPQQQQQDGGTITGSQKEPSSPLPAALPPKLAALSALGAAGQPVQKRRQVGKDVSDLEMAQSLGAKSKSGSPGGAGGKGGASGKKRPQPGTESQQQQQQGEAWTSLRQQAKKQKGGS